MAAGRTRSLLRSAVSMRLLPGGGLLRLGAIAVAPRGCWLVALLAIGGAALCCIPPSLRSSIAAGTRLRGRLALCGIGGCSCRLRRSIAALGCLAGTIGRLTGCLSSRLLLLLLLRLRLLLRLLASIACQAGRHTGIRRIQCVDAASP